MSSAFKSFTSAAGLGSACYLLATATWDQVLLLFLFASLGWCLFVWRHEMRKNTYGPRYVSTKRSEIIDTIIPPRKAIAQPIPAPAPVRSEKPRTIYKFPIHELSRMPLRAEEAAY